MNASRYFAGLLPDDAVRRAAARSAGAGRCGSIDDARADVAARFADDLCGLLNALSRGELASLAAALGVAADARAPALRAALWDRGAELERSGAAWTAALQPRPVVLGGHLVIQARPRGLYPASERWPRALPDPRDPAPPADEPDSLDELLAAADRALGVPLGPRGRDKGAWGVRAAALLGVVERGHGEPDWRGDVELKTVPVAPDPGGIRGQSPRMWRVVEDPAIAMGPSGALGKLQRTLWLARADTPGAGATLVSWYLLEWDAHVARLAHRDLHVRPKGPRGTDQRGLYLRKRFFADAGLLATLNGP